MLPIETYKDGDKITKVCVEDFYKVINRVYETLDKSYNEASEALESVHKTYSAEDGEYQGELIIGKGSSEPCSGDSFDEEIGNEIAFKKAKLNANLKKHKVLVRVLNAWGRALDSLVPEIAKVEKNILMDINGIRKYNPKYGVSW